uniref:Uncharacterized protein n=1 Tax=Romanomermis culicivorax TaxID=13658 RepID=A0A915JEC6_ROMCU
MRDVERNQPVKLEALSTSKSKKYRRFAELYHQYLMFPNIIRAMVVNVLQALKSLNLSRIQLQHKYIKLTAKNSKKFTGITANTQNIAAANFSVIYGESFDTPFIDSGVSHNLQAYTFTTNIVENQFL